MLWYYSGGVLGLLSSCSETLGAAAPMLRLLGRGFDLGSGGGGGKKAPVSAMCTGSRGEQGAGCQLNHYMAPCCAC